MFNNFRGLSDWIIRYKFQRIYFFPLNILKYK